MIGKVHQHSIIESDDIIMMSSEYGAAGRPMMVMVVRVVVVGVVVVVTVVMVTVVMVVAVNQVLALVVDHVGVMSEVSSCSVVSVVCLL